MGVLKNIGGYCFKFSLIYSLATSALTVLLTSAGIPIPEYFNYTWFDPNSIINWINGLVGQSLFVGTGSFFGGLGFAAVNILFGVVTSVPKSFTVMASYIAPELVPIAQYVGGFVATMSIWYMFASVFKIDL